MEKAKKIRRFVGIAILVLALILGGLAIGFKIYTSHYYATDIDAVLNSSNEYEDKVLSFSDKDGAVFLPKDKNYRAIIVFYPGAKVEYTAYSSLMYELASRGFVCLLTRMPENIALLSVDAIDSMVPWTVKRQEAAVELDWYMAGHSLGGTAATKYLEELFSDDKERSPEDESSINVVRDAIHFKGLILCGSYPSFDISNAPIRLLSIYGSNDEVLNMNAYEENKANWPEDSTEIVIDGGNHSYFGTYGIQDGDGTPSISNQEQIDITAQIIDDWIGK